MRVVLRQLRPAIVAVVVFTVVCGVAYPLVVTAAAQLGWSGRADGALVERGGVVVGSELLGQPFTSPQYFHPRPSAAGDGYDASMSGGSNLGPTNPVLLDLVAERVAAYRAENGLAADTLVPVDAVTASGSGLDPQISVRNARLQAPRVATARNLALSDVLDAIAEHTTSRPFGILGDPGVNIVALNLALDGTMTS
jgi:K+-transporting ATPase ATPase C chain